MANRPLYSSSITGIFSVLGPITISGQRATFPSGVGAPTDFGDVVLDVRISQYTPDGINMSEDDLAFISGSVYLMPNDDELIAVVDTTDVNIVVTAANATSVTPVGPSVVTFELKGQVISHMDRTFSLDVGCYDYETRGMKRWTAVCHLANTKRWEKTNLPNEGSSVAVRARWMMNDPPYAHFVVENMDFIGRASGFTSASASPSKGVSPAKKALFGGKRRRAEKVDAEDEGISQGAAKIKKIVAVEANSTKSARDGVQTFDDLVRISQSIPGNVGA